MSDNFLQSAEPDKKSIWGKIVDIDWLVLLPAVLISLAGIFTMGSFVDNNPYFYKQIFWLVICIVAFFTVSLFDLRFLRRTGVVFALYIISFISLLILFILGSAHKGAQSWFSIGGVSFQPVDAIKLVIIILLAKYFSRRHIEIANIRHILVSGFYVFIIFALVFLQPDFGSALMVFSIWIGMVLVSGISKKHILLVFLLGGIAFGALWVGVFQDYQKKRIVNFLHPLSDIRGAGYSAYQSTVAVGSGEILGKGLGYGTQSKLKFLPEYHTDFVFAAFAEEWGFFGVLILLSTFFFLLWRILQNSYYGATNFEILFGLGLVIVFLAHFLINAGMNIGLMPVTGVTFPFMSYGGTHMLASYTGLGMLMAMRRYRKNAHSNQMKNEFLGL